MQNLCCKIQNRRQRLAGGDNCQVVFAGDYCIAARMRISQVVINLLNNAIKFTEDGSIAITLDTTRNSEQDYAIVKVTERFRFWN